MWLQTTCAHVGPREGQPLLHCLLWPAAQLGAFLPPSSFVTSSEAVLEKVGFKHVTACPEHTAFLRVELACKSSWDGLQDTLCLLVLDSWRENTHCTHMCFSAEGHNSWRTVPSAAWAKFHHHLRVFCIRFNKHCFTHYRLIKPNSENKGRERELCGYITLLRLSESGWWDGSGIEKTPCSSRGCEFRSQHPCRWLMTVIPDPGRHSASSLYGYLHTCTHPPLPRVNKWRLSKSTWLS